MADLRSALEAAMEQAEDGSLQAHEEREIEVDNEPLRNEKGQFVSKDAEEPEEEAPQAEAEPDESQAEPVEAQEQETEEEPEEPVSSVPRPTTWKKEYLPLWDKLDKGEALTADEAKKFLAYTTQRESEYKKGVSAYKAEADNARMLNEAIAPVLPELQRNGIHPAAWINNLGLAHMKLAKGSYQEKVQLFEKLAQDYGIDLQSAYSGADTTQYVDPQAQALMQQINMLNQQVQQVTSWREQEEQNRLQSEIVRFSEGKPHFDALRETMAQLLESGQAQDLDSAYDKAKWLVPEVREQELSKLTQTAKTQVSNAQRVQKAKAAAVSPKSVTPNGSVTTGEKKDRRSLLEEQIKSNLSDRV